jgi:hypothetical protein
MRVILLILFLFFAVPGSAHKNENWYISPNPAKTYFNIECKEGMLSPFVKIYNNSGLLVYKQYIGTDIKYAHIEINLPPGVYIVFLESDNK